MMESDEALLARVSAGDQQATAALVARYAPRVLRFGLKLCRDEEDAREVLQQTLLTAARGLRGFRGESRLVTWLFSIARSFCIKQRTRGHAAVRTEPLDDTVLELPAPEREMPDRQLAAVELQAALEVGIRRLEPSQREVLVLRDVEGLSAAEVAQVLGLSIEAVKSRLHRARRALRETLAPFFAPDRPKAGCPDVIELLSRYQEGEITGEVCKAMEAHIEACDGCAARCDSLRRVLSACSASEEPRLPPELHSAVLGQVREALKEQVALR
jgi:RNA polymerase sigma-70 factor (ECF subfamily)